MQHTLSVTESDVIPRRLSETPDFEAPLLSIHGVDPRKSSGVHSQVLAQILHP